MPCFRVPRFIQAVAILAIVFINSYALKYLLPSAATLGIYEPRRDWLIVHVAAGAAALLLGPAQFWLATKNNFGIWHRALGVGYVIAIVMSATAAVYLAVHTTFGWVFGMGMVSLAAVWIGTTALAVLAICRFAIQQHKEWMIRSYVVTFSFVFFRVVVEVLETMEVGTLTDRLVAASWLCWSIPLFILEGVLQGRKMFLPAEGKTK
jgi:hypothetical protein